jgi:hypothetical protein
VNGALSTSTSSMEPPLLTASTALPSSGSFRHIRQSFNSRSPQPDSKFYPSHSFDPSPPLLPPPLIPFAPILPRSAPSSLQYRKACETCGCAHDGSFGAGRFCSSRCARTVGGLAHRRKRLAERAAATPSFISTITTPSSTTDFAVHDDYNPMSSTERYLLSQPPSHSVVVQTRETYSTPYTHQPPANATGQIRLANYDASHSRSTPIPNLRRVEKYIHRPPRQPACLRKLSRPSRLSLELPRIDPHSRHLGVMSISAEKTPTSPVTPTSHVEVSQGNVNCVHPTHHVDNPTKIESVQPLRSMSVSALLN